MNGNELKLWIASLTTCNFNTVQSNRWILIVTNIAQFLLLLKRTPFIKRTLEKEVSLYFECYATMPMFADARSYFELWLPSCDQFTIKYNPRLLFISEYTEVTYFDRPHVMFINKNGNTCSMIMLLTAIKKGHEYMECSNRSRWNVKKASSQSSVCCISHAKKCYAFSLAKCFISDFLRFARDFCSY